MTDAFPSPKNSEAGSAPEEKNAADPIKTMRRNLIFLRKLMLSDACIFFMEFKYLYYNITFKQPG